MYLRHKIKSIVSPVTFSNTKSLVILGVLWTIVHLILLWHFGIVTEFESKKYIEQADSFLTNREYTSPNFIFYSIQILLIALSKSTNTYPHLIVFVQLLFNALSMALFYKLNFYCTKNHFKAFIVTALLICMIYYEIYDLYLFTESLYFSFGIIYTYFLFSINKLSLKNIYLLILGMAVLYFTRPTGIFFIPSTIAFCVFKFYRNKALLLLALFFVAGILTLYYLLNFALGSGGELDFLLPYSKEMILCGVPTLQSTNAINIPLNKSPMEGLWYIMTHHSTLFFYLVNKRLAAFWGATREYYSPLHNMFLRIYFYTCYLIILFGLRKLFKKLIAETIYLLCNIFLIMSTAALSCDEWHNRFLLSILPFLLLLVSFVIKRKVEN
jgi:hypothetical protein